MLAWIRELPARALAGGHAATLWTHEAFDRATAAPAPLFPSLGFTFASVPVDHCPGARGVLLRHRMRLEWSVAYSGDGRPSGAFAQLARGAALLVHECTFACDLSGEAVRKRHCTLSEAVGVSLASGAWRTVFTHFSQRYPHALPSSSDAAGAHVLASCFFAVDGLVLPFSDLAALPQLRARAAASLGV